MDCKGEIPLCGELNARTQILWVYDFLSVMMPMNQ